MSYSRSILNPSLGSFLLVRAPGAHPDRAGPGSLRAARGSSSRLDRVLLVGEGTLRACLVSLGFHTQRCLSVLKECQGALGLLHRFLGSASERVFYPVWGVPSC